MDISYIPTERALNPTSIDLGEYVINPYRGCSYGCIYCYVPYNKSIMRMNKKWGSFVGVRNELPEVLEKEIDIKKPTNVLIGSTCESFMPIERKYNITKRILEILNRKGVYFSILTRSPLIADYVDLLKEGYCKSIYFTTNNYSDDIKNLLEPETPRFEDRNKTILCLKNNSINVIPYISPFIPELTNIDMLLDVFDFLPEINFEALNFNLGSIDKIIALLSKADNELGQTLNRMKNDALFYETIWCDFKKEIQVSAQKRNIKQIFYLHELNAYFENKYNNDLQK